MKPTLRARLLAAWRAFREPERAYWMGFRAARIPLMEVLRTLHRRGDWEITLSKWVLMKMLWPIQGDRQRVEDLLDAEERE